MPGSVLDSEQTAGVNVDRILSFIGLPFELGKTSKTQTNEYIVHFKYM